MDEKGLCKFHQMGMCVRGAACHYPHGPTQSPPGPGAIQDMYALPSPEFFKQSYSRHAGKANGFLTEQQLPMVPFAGSSNGSGGDLPSVAPPSDRVWVKGLRKNVVHDNLVSTFAQFGNVIDAKILPAKYDQNNDISAIVRMGSVDEAAHLIRSLNSKEDPLISIGTLTLKFANPDGKPAPVTDRVWIRGIPLGTDVWTLKDLFKGYGTILDAKVLPQKYPTDADLSAIIRFSEEGQAQWLVENLNGNRIPGVDFPLTVKFANPSCSVPHQGARYSPYGNSGGWSSRSSKSQSMLGW